ncbi:putative ABC transporter%2C ATP-binding component [Chlamydia trachomatis]|nr:putative ABC transporter%2C ATP-binding component [Chlamydia trachomatis]
MDEPTNFLDIRAIEALEELLQGYDRPLLFVTHDVSFINNVADSLLLIESEKITGFEGNLQQYNEENEV